jgi:hypothetical protein
VAVDLPQCQHHPHLRSCWRSNLDWEAVKWETVAKVGMAALRPPCQQMRNIPARCCLNPLQCLVFDSETADELVAHVKPDIPLRKNAAQLLGKQHKLN